MSTSLYWSLVPEEQKEHNLYDLKWIMAKRLSDSDGSCSQDLGIVDEKIIPFLEGVASSNRKEVSEDAEALIDAIKKYGRVQLTIHS